VEDIVRQLDYIIKLAEEAVRDPENTHPKTRLEYILLKLRYLRRVLEKRGYI